MRLVGFDRLQARSAYQPIVHFQNGRWIAYIGHHSGQALNNLAGVVEPNGTSIIDVTDPTRPRYLFHIPGRAGAGETAGAQMVRVCNGDVLPKGTPGRTYLLRTAGNVAQEVWDVTTPNAPFLLTTVVTGLNGTHKNWWECDTGIAYLVIDGRPFGWRSNRITRIVNLSDPAHLIFIRDFGLPGQEPGSTGPIPPGVHGPISTGPAGNRVYFAYGTSGDGILQIVDRQKLLTGPSAPTPASFLFPQVGRLEMSPNWGGHTTFPLLRVPILDWAQNRDGNVRDFVVVVSEAPGNQCQEFRHLTFIVDVTTESKPQSVANFQVPESDGKFCARGGRFGPHSTNESFTPIYYRKLIFIAYFNAGVRAVDIRDPYNPREVAFYIPATTADTSPRCVTISGIETCKIAIQTNNVEVDDRGLVYIVDRANTGLHILELTGDAKKIVE